MLGAVLLDLDAVTNPLVDVAGSLLGTSDYDDPDLVALVRTPRYQTLLQVADECVAAGVPAILVGPFTAERRDPAAWAALADRLTALGARVRLAWLRLPADELARRIAARGAERDSGKLEDLAAFLREAGATPAVPFIEVDALLPPEEQARSVLVRLDSPASQP